MGGVLEEVVGGRDHPIRAVLDRMGRAAQAVIVDPGKLLPAGQIIRSSLRVRSGWGAGNFPKSRFKVKSSCSVRVGRLVYQSSTIADWATPMVKVMVWSLRGS